jgi:hypothetical protein
LTEKISIKILVEWIGILLIFSIISAIGNVVGYQYPFMESLIGMFILCGISLAGLIIERYVPWEIRDEASADCRRPAFEGKPLRAGRRGAAACDTHRLLPSGRHLAAFGRVVLKA